MDQDDDEEQGTQGIDAHPRASSIARGYQALGARTEFHCLDSDAEDAGSRAPSVPCSPARTSTFKAPVSRVIMPATPRTRPMSARKHLNAALQFSGAEPAPAAPAPAPAPQRKQRPASASGNRVAAAVATWETKAQQQQQTATTVRQRPQSAGAIRSSAVPAPAKRSSLPDRGPPAPLDIVDVMNLEGLLRKEAGGRGNDSARGGRLTGFGLVPNVVRKQVRQSPRGGSRPLF